MIKKSTASSLMKIVLFLVFLPLALIWYVWKKTEWDKMNKWIATAVIAVVFLIIFASIGEREPIPKEVASSSSQVEDLQKQPEEEKQKNAGLEKAEREAEKAAINAGKVFQVEHVVDGDTVKLTNGQVVRYIGIDTPEVASPEIGSQCFGKEASEKNRELAEGKEVRLVKDVSETDKYNRILRYVWVGDIFVNDYLVRNGFGKASNFPPDEKYKDQFKSAQEEAKANKRGLWADDACKAKTEAVPTPVPTPVPTASSAGKYTCDCSKTCPNMSSCAEAQYQLDICGCTRRDGDKDGIACDADCQ